MLKEWNSQFPKLKQIFGIIILVLILDQISKYAARIYLQPVHSVSVIGDFFRLTYVENPGIAFGIRIGNKLFFTILSIIAIVVIFYYLITLRDRLTLRYAFAIILGGAFGNLLDRFLYGRVVDFMDFDFIDIRLPSFEFLFIDFNGYVLTRWPVFNVADMAVSVGMVVIIAHAIFDNVGSEEESHVASEQD